jgi:hypothetical protein
MLAGAFVAMALLIILKVGITELLVVAAIVVALFFVVKGPRRGGPGNPPGGAR